MTRAGSVSQPDHQTLRKPEDFRRVLARGSRRRAGPIVVVRAPGPTGPPRVGLVVTRDSGNAVTRNRIKRRLRHAVAGIGLQPGSDYVILANREVSKVGYADLVSWLTGALS